MPSLVRLNSVPNGTDPVGLLTVTPPNQSLGFVIRSALNGCDKQIVKVFKSYFDSFSDRDCELLTVHESYKPNPSQLLDATYHLRGPY